MHATDFATMSASIITSSDGVTYRGVRLTWTYNSHTYTSCSDYSYYRARAYSSSYYYNRYEIDVTFSQNEVQFLNLDCNNNYNFDVNVYGVLSSNGYTTSYSNKDVYLFYGRKLKKRSLVAM